LKILLADDHPLFLEGLKNLLVARGLNVVATASSGEEALRKVSCESPDVILMDIMMKPMSGLLTTRMIKSKYPDIKIVMLTASETEEDLFEAIKSGASGYLLKSLNFDKLYEMLLQFEQGEIPVSPGLATLLLEEFKKNDHRLTTDFSESSEDDEKINKLSIRQKEVLILVAKGMKYKEIAVLLGITERTVKYYMEMILKKLYMENRSQAIRYAIEEGFVD
jgi:two-component system NarL family response regulator